MSGLARTYRGAASAAGPLLYLAETRRAALGEWVEIEAPSGTYRGQVIDVGAGITVVQVLEDTLGLHPASARITLTGEQARAVVGRELLGRALSGIGLPLDGLLQSIREANVIVHSKGMEAAR